MQEKLMGDITDDSQCPEVLPQLIGSNIILIGANDNYLNLAIVGT